MVSKKKKVTQSRKPVKFQQLKRRNKGPRPVKKVDAPMPANKRRPKAVSAAPGRATLNVAELRRRAGGKLYDEPFPEGFTIG